MQPVLLGRRAADARRLDLIEYLFDSGSMGAAVAQVSSLLRWPGARPRGPGTDWAAWPPRPGWHGRTCRGMAGRRAWPGGGRGRAEGAAGREG